MPLPQLGGNDQMAFLIQICSILAPIQVIFFSHSRGTGPGSPT
ncbi:hypothetical protein [Ruegeria arenilitoris]|nr:hypothetical protein [Ruegeria arenilitoris]